jgi:ABC-type transport system substrate-binding protein
MPVAVPAWLEAGRTGNQHIGILHWTLSDPGTNLRIMFHSANAKAFSWTGHKNSRLDDMLDQGMIMTDPQKRCVLYEEVQQIILKEAMVKPLHLWSRVWGVRVEVNGLKLDEASPSFFWAFDAYLER